MASRGVVLPQRLDQVYANLLGAFTMADLKPQLSDFNWPDPFLLDSQLSEDDRMLRDAAA